MFGLTNALNFSFSERFIQLFWRIRVQSKGVEIGFEEFIKTFSIWCRGNPNERIYLLFKLFDRGEKGYVTKDDIIDIFYSLLMCYFKSGMSMTTFEFDSQEFKAKVVVDQHSEEEIVLCCKELLNEWAEITICQFHCSDTQHLLWFEEFKNWVVRLPGVAEALCIPSGVREWLTQKH